MVAFQDGLRAQADAKGERLRARRRAQRRPGHRLPGLTERRAQAPGIPPTLPGSSVPSRIAFQNAGVFFGSSCTVEPTPPGR